MKSNDFEPLTDLLVDYIAPYGREVNESLVKLFFNALADYEIEDIRKAFAKHVRDPAEGKFCPMPAHLMAYLPSLDGRPDGEAIWGLLPFDEGTAAFLPAEAMQAFWNTVYPALEAGKSAETARPFFMKDYARLVQQSRDRGEPLKIEVTIGQRGQGEHIRALQAAVKVGAVPLAYVQNWMQRVLPGHPTMEALPGPSEPGKSSDFARIGHAG